MNVRTRFAPSPTGFIHIGGIYSALLDYAFAKKHKGKFFLRIEDTDQKRCVKGAEEAIIKGLKWVNLKPDGIYHQSERLSVYQNYAHQLVKQGFAYYCFCSSKRLEELRSRQQRKKQRPCYDRFCRDQTLSEAEKRIKKGEKYVIRLKIPDNEKIMVKRSSI